jgi:hypothetical protein
MSDDWDSEPAPALAASSVVDPWADEDADDPVADSWDAEPESEAKKDLQPPPKPKQLSKQKQKKKEEEEKRAAERKVIIISTIYLSLFC